MVCTLPPDFLKFTFLASPYKRIETCPVSHPSLLITVIFLALKQIISERFGRCLNQVTSELSIVEEHTLFVTHIV